MIACFNTNAMCSCVLALVHFLMVLFRLSHNRSGVNIFGHVPFLICSTRLNKKLATCKSLIPPSATSAVSKASTSSPGLRSVTTHCAH